MAHHPCAIVGIGQTHHKSRRWDVSVAGLVREAALRAMEDAQMTWRDIDAVVIGKAPDLFEGVMKPELYLTDALGVPLEVSTLVFAGLLGIGSSASKDELKPFGIEKRVLWKTSRITGSPEPP
mgnify:CR=1 FL=1